MTYDNILTAIKNACIHISLSLKSGNTGELSNQVGYINKSGDYSNNIDLYSNQIIKNELIKCLNVWGIASEEDEGIVSRFSDDDDCTYFVSFDPLDGSSNVDCNISVGTIFCIFNTPEGVYPKSGNDIVCAGYCLYSQCTQLVIAEKDNVKLYTLQPHIKTFTEEGEIKVPEKGCLYSINESNKYKWNQIKNNGTIISENNTNKCNSIYSQLIDKFIDKKYTMRWVGTMVADCHRTLLKGGLFAYPSDSNNTEGRIRLVYEAYPFAYIFQQANGYSSNGYTNILQLEFPKNIHQKTPVLLCGKEEWEQFIKITSNNI
jgi:fructose-1,6-bisphosphatase I